MNEWFEKIKIWDEENKNLEEKIKVLENEEKKYSEVIKEKWNT